MTTRAKISDAALLYNNFTVWFLVVGTVGCANIETCMSVCDASWKCNKFDRHLSKINMLRVTVVSFHTFPFRSTLLEGCPLHQPKAKWPPPHKYSSTHPKQLTVTGSWLWGSPVLSAFGGRIIFLFFFFQSESLGLRKKKVYSDNACLLSY